MLTPKTWHWFSSFFIGCFLPVLGDWQEETGMDDLLMYLDEDSHLVPPTITEGVPLAIVEASSQDGGDPSQINELRFLPVNFPHSTETTSAPLEGDYAGITFLNESVDLANDGFGNYNGLVMQSSSKHAETVAHHYFSPDSYATGSTSVHCYEAQDFVSRTLHGPLTPSAGKIMSHAWVDRTDLNTAREIADYARLIKRFDYLGSTGNTLMVVGVDNGGATRVPTLWGPAYNAVQVGITNGDHSTGDTQDTFQEYGITSGRTRPDIVSNSPFTSYATGQVASGAAYLYGLAQSLNFTEITANTDLQRAILLAGATKEEFPNWGNMSTTPSLTTPLDPTYGAGEMNIFHSHRIIEQGSPSDDKIPFHGWKRARISDTAHRYEITIPEEASTAEFSAVLCWNREITEHVTGKGRHVSFSYEAQDLADLRLELRDAAGAIISDSPIDNVEHLYVKDLPPGDYSLVVSNNTGASLSTDFSLAWRTNLTAKETPSLTASAEGLELSNVIPGLNYSIYASADGETWMLAETITPDRSTLAWTPEETGKNKGRFYRIDYWE